MSQFATLKKQKHNGSNDKEQEFLNILEGHKHLIFKIANAYCYEEDARKDLVQEIVLQLWRAFPKYDPQFSLSTWIYRIALNVSISHLRKESTRKKHQEAYSEILELQGDGDWFDNAQVKQLYRFIEGLKSLDKAIMILFLEEKGNKEIAEIMGITASNVSTRMHRIKQKLSTYFQTLKH